MKKNVGIADRIIRVILAAIFAALYFTGILSSTVGLLLVIFGVILLLTSVVGSCPVYMAFGLNSGKKEKHAHS